jgi:hypothetical protein
MVSRALELITYQQIRAAIDHADPSSLIFWILTLSDAFGWHDAITDQVTKPGLELHLRTLLPPATTRPIRLHQALTCLPLSNLAALAHLLSANSHLFHGCTHLRPRNDRQEAETGCSEHPASRTDP